MDDGDGGYGGRSMFPTGGQIILSALQNSNNNKSQHPSHESLTMDPAVAAVGPTLPQQPWMTSSSSYEHDLFLQSFRQAQNPWSSSSGNTNFPGNTSQRDDMWGSGFQNQMPEMRIGSFPLSSSSGDGLLNSNRVDNAAAASDLLSRLKGVNDYSFGVGDGNFVEPGRSRQFELQGSSSNSSVQRLGNYGNFEYERTGNGGLDRKDHGVVHRSPYDNELSRQGHGVVHRSSRDDGLSRQDHGVAHMSYRDDGLSRHDHGVVHRSSRDDGLSRQDHGVVHRSPGDGGLSRQVHRVVNRAGYSLYNEGLSRQDPLYDKGLSRQDYNAVHRSLNEGRSSSQDHGVVYSSSLEKRRTPPGFPSNPQEGRNLVGRNNRIFEQNVGIANDDFGESSNTSVTSIGNERGRNPSHANSRANAFQNSRVIEQFDRPGPPTGSNLHSVRASAIEGSLQDLHAEITNIANEQGYHKKAEIQSDVDGSIDKSDQKKAQNIREKYARSDTRGNWLLSQKMRNHKRLMLCRSDIGLLNAPLLAIYESLIPAAEEKAKQKQLFALLERLVSGEWPEAKLYLYGSCANSFDVSKSDIDVCLAIDDPEINKSDFLLRLAEILESNNLQNVQALTRARVPIVKLKDPVTGISCDICMNNVLAVVNTKLLRDYAEVDVRLRQLAFLVKHWAKSRGVNETYQGTLSSYAYVLMCIHFLQQRKPAVLPCLQEMEPTYSVTVNDVKCAYFDRVEKLYGYGSRNKESISQLLWGFFSYWAYGHDYANNAISVRTGSIISKQSKDWTTRVGNDRHLICIEDPFQTSHDLGRVVDKYSIKVVREEFERAAHIMQHDPNPCVKLFETYVPEREPLE